MGVSVQCVPTQPFDGTIGYPVGGFVDFSFYRAADRRLVVPSKQQNAESMRALAAPGRYGISVGRKWVEWVMRGAGLQDAFLRRRWRSGSTRADPPAAPAPDLVKRVFTAGRPNRLGVDDATRIPCEQARSGRLRRGTPFSDGIVGWKTRIFAIGRDTEVVLLESAIWSCDLRDGELIHRSDRGLVLCSETCINQLADNGIAQSM